MAKFIPNKTNTDPSIERADNLKNNAWASIPYIVFAFVQSGSLHKFNLDKANAFVSFSPFQKKRQPPHLPGYSTSLTLVKWFYIDKWQQDVFQ